MNESWPPSHTSEIKNDFKKAVNNIPAEKEQPIPVHVKDIETLEEQRQIPTTPSMHLRPKGVILAETKDAQEREHKIVALRERIEYQRGKARDDFNLRM